MTRATPLHPNDSPGFLLWHATLRWQRGIAQALAPLDLTHVQFVLLACTWWLNEQGERPNQVAVAAQAGTDIKMTSQVLRNLERKGLVEREVDTVDTRAAVFGLRNVERHSRRVRSRSSRRSTLVSSPTSPQLSRCASCALSRSWTWPSRSRFDVLCVGYSCRGPWGGFEISATISPTDLSFASSAMSACDTTPMSRFSSSTTGRRRT